MRIAVRVDASKAIGSGHFMRCLTLADVLTRSRADVRFISRHLPVYLESMLRERAHELVRLAGEDDEAVDELARARWLGTSQEADAAATTEALSDQPWDWIIVDHYALDLRWERLVRERVPRMMVIDDLADRAHDCEVLLDQNHYADAERRYGGKVPADCDLLLGPRYALLRDEFASARERVRPRSGSVSRLLVSFGGVDARGYTGHALEAISRLCPSAFDVDVVIGEEHPARHAIETTCASHHFCCHVQTDRMAELMAAADLAVGAGGVALWERCCLGLPALALTTAVNQAQQVRDAAAEAWVCAPDIPQTGDPVPLLVQHLAVLLGNERLRHAMSRLGMRAVDGNGASRVVRQLGVIDVQVREATRADAESLFAWRNHPTVREVSRNQALIDRASHERWLGSVLSDAQRLLVIGERAGSPVGVVRFDLAGEDAEVSIYLVPGSHARGTGTNLLAAAEQYLAASRAGVRRLRAHVLGDNTRSHGLFTGSGYHLGDAWYSKELVQR